ncbi:hypothetical protein U5817_09890 [Aromatoleum evansii]|uniref:Uncharacterized protein n=1 Tax=Aromatoleum evansii TaxID=59406 RepID=A0ABZ1AV52_AROEV|nr:hypothetical protein U5817_09540 [Aromatoleum evansii]WRL48337.1 hypothetical protein U5817_09890 [Aromatoleum evansii]
MAESWVRLWAGMTLNAKWQTIARKSGQRRSLVIAMFTHLLMIANESDPRGSLEGADIEDIASALDEDEEAIQAIWDVLIGRAIDPETLRLTGWEKHQPAREDAITPTAKTAAERKRDQRERERMSRDVTQSHEQSRDVTQSHAPEAEADTEAEKPIPPEREVTVSGEGGREEPLPSLSRKGLVCRLLRDAGIADAAPHHLADETWDALLTKRTDEEIVEFAKVKLSAKQGHRIGLKYLAPGLLEDPTPITPNARGSPPGRRMTRDESRTIAASTRLSDFRAACAEEQGAADERTIEATAPPRLVG